MEVTGRTFVVTGGADGIGFGLARRFAGAGARVVIADIADHAAQAARSIGARHVRTDVSQERDIARLVQNVLDVEGRLDILCSNAGIGPPMDPFAPQPLWDKIFAVNLMSHVWAARYALPDMLRRGEGYLLNMASASGLLTELTNPGYAATKHGAVGLAEWLAFTYADRGIRVSVICPQAVATSILNEAAPYLAADAITVEEAADVVFEAVRDERFMIFTHPATLPRFQRKAADYEGYIAAMRSRLREVEHGHR